MRAHDAHDLSGLSQHTLSATMTDHYIAGLEQANRDLHAKVKDLHDNIQAALAGTHHPEHGWQCPCCTHVRRELGAET